LSGETVILKSDIVADTEVCAKTMLPGAIAEIVPPLNATEDEALTDVGVAVIVSVAVDPACNEIGPQLIPVPVLPAPQVPALMLPVMLVSGTPVAAISARIVMLLARSGPPFVIVYVNVAGFPAAIRLWFVPNPRTPEIEILTALPN